MKILLIKNLFTLFFCTAILISNNTYADSSTLPSVDIKNGLIGPDNGITKGVTSLEITPEMSVSFRFKRMLGKTKSEIEVTDKLFKEGMLIHYKKVKNKYNFFIYHDVYFGEFKNQSSKVKGIYILDENDQCIGYCFFEQKNIFYRKNEPEIVKIKSLKVHPNYLKNYLKIPASQITFYEQEHGDYIERYAINDQFFFMDAFYPKVLEQNIKDRVIEVLNYNYEHSPENNPGNQPYDENATLFDNSENNNDEK
jgi:hypothetical protein